MRTFGKYRLVEPIASGGMADVWRAEVTGAEGVVKEVALKLVRGEHAARGDFVRMFVEEARLASRLSHANVVQVFEFDQIDGCYYLAMELVRGRHLGRVVERARELGIRFGVARAVQVGADVARALAYVHRISEGGRPLGLVHRDVSPHNVLLSFEGEVKLADFGIARAMDHAGLTEPGTVKGKVAYMAPEQARGGDLDARADVFSLGVVLWELLAGRRLFLRDSDAATLAGVLSDEPVSPPSAWNDEVPPELDAAVLAALARDPALRTRSAQELGTALAGVLLKVARGPEDVDLRAFMQRLFAEEVAAADAPRPEPTRVRPVPVAAEPVAEATPERGDATPGTTATRTAPGVRARRLRRRAAGVAVAIAAATAGVLGVAAARRAAGEAARAAQGASADARPAPAASPRSPDDAPPARAPEATAAVSPAPSPAPPPPPATVPAAVAVLPARPAAPLDSVQALNALELPSKQSGEGILSVNALPWGVVSVDGSVLGETPRELRLQAGWHRVRIERGGRRPAEKVVLVKAGARTKILR